MGWEYEYLKDELMEQLRKEPIIKEGLKEWGLGEEGGYFEFSETLLNMVEYGSDTPETGEHKNFPITLRSDKDDKICEINISFIIRRTRPANGFDYEPYEREYEIVLIKCNEAINI